MSKPIIGITVESKYEPQNLRSRGTMQLNWNYAQAVADAGGVPIVIPPTADMGVIARLIDGWLIPGGLDIDAGEFGEENHPSVELQHPSRFEAESRLYRQITPDLPVLGICYGCQFLNVVRGGSLVQHLPDVVGNADHGSGNPEEVSVAPSSKLAELVEVSQMEGRSYHHQAVNALGDNLAVVASGSDGVVEGIEASDRPWMVAVQWHPERSPDDEANRRLFEKFIEAAEEYSRTKARAKP